MHLLNKLVVASIPAVPRPLVRYFAGRYIAGETLEDAVGNGPRAERRGGVRDAGRPR